MSPPNPLQTALEQARAQTDALFGLLRPGSIYERPVAERHRLIFYFGHLEAFDWNQVCRGALEMDSFHSEFDRLFAFGIDPEPGKAPSDQPADWPSIAEVERYRRRVREAIDAAWRRAPRQIVHVAIEHRLMHAETFAYLLHNLPPGHKVAPTGMRPGDGRPAPSPSMVEIPGGPALLGRKRHSGFGWDNEFEEHTVDVPPFAISKYKVTNQEYLEFVRTGADPPHFWRQGGDGWYYRAMFGEIPLPMAWPVYVTYRQAAAYTKWRGMSLPTEAQFHRAAFGAPHDEHRSYPWGEDASQAGNFDFAGWDPVPVDATPGGDSTFGVSQLVGNGWEWTSTVFWPFAGFEPFPFYPGYSADFFDGAHYVSKGASARTARALLRRSFRNWFRPNYPYVYAGFRCVEN